MKTRISNLILLACSIVTPVLAQPAMNIEQTLSNQAQGMTVFLMDWPFWPGRSKRTPTVPSDRQRTLVRTLVRFISKTLPRGVIRIIYWHERHRRCGKRVFGSTHTCPETDDH